MNTLIEKPKIRLFGFNSGKKNYSGEINETEFWFSWSKQLKNLKHGNPVVKGKMERIDNVTKIKIQVKENSIYVFLTFTFIILIALTFFSIKLFRETDKMTFNVIGFFILLTIGLTILNMWKVKRGMNKMTEELKDIFDDIKTNNC